MITTSNREATEARYATLGAEKGWTRSAAPPCPRAVAGRSCRSYEADELCECIRHHHVLDHARSWQDGAGRVVLTAEPYTTVGDELVALVRDLDALGLHLHVSGRSPWNPGATLRLTITATELEVWRP